MCAKTTSIKLPCCIKLAFQIISRGRCTVKQTSNCLDTLSRTVHAPSCHTVGVTDLQAPLQWRVLFWGKENAASVWNRVFIFGRACVRDGSALFENAVTCWDYIALKVEFWYMSVECWWNDTVKVKLKGLKRNVLSCHFIHIKFCADWTGMVSKHLLFVLRQIASHRSVALLRREAPNGAVGLSALQCSTLKTLFIPALLLQSCYTS